MNFQDELQQIIQATLRHVPPGHKVKKIVIPRVTFKGYRVEFGDVSRPEVHTFKQCDDDIKAKNKTGFFDWIKPAKSRKYVSSKDHMKILEGKESDEFPD